MRTTLGYMFSVRARTLAIVILVATAWTIEVFAHRVIGRRDPTGNTALLQSPTASPVDLPIPIFSTGLSVICVRVTNTSTADSRITGVGLELPGVRSGFSLVSPLDRGLSIHENITQVPGFPGVTLDLAIVASPNFIAGSRRPGLAPNAPPTMVCVSGPFPAQPIETLLNGVFVAFEGEGSPGNAFDVGVWERR